MAELRPLISGFLSSSHRFPDRPALAIQSDQWTYADLHQRASDITHTISAAAKAGFPDLVGVFGHRSVAAFSGVVAVLLGGGAYVPLNPTFPAERTLQMIERAALSWIIAEREALDDLLQLLQAVSRPMSIVVPDLFPGDEMPCLPEGCAQHQLLGAGDLVSAGLAGLPAIESESLAYLLFTSGSTGMPKGVKVKQSNVTAFVDVMVERYGVNEKDRLSQTFDLTFDLSAFDMFVAWERGACVCCPTQGEKMLPAKYVKSQNLTIWFSVPSTAIMMKRLRMLKPDSYPTLRYSLFCGEALPLDVTEAFQQSAPASIVENLYGPTELTIACTLYRYNRATTANESELGVVPIGYPYPNMSVLIVDETLQEVAVGEAGELLMTGPQLSAGYWQDDEKTAAAFVVPPGKDAVYYRTGDRVRQAATNAPLLYLGRVDNQIKVQGYRVELGEIEAVLREVAQADVAIAIGYPEGIEGAEGIVAFVSPSDVSNKEVSAAAAAHLPGYMQPKELVRVEDFPLNANGKVDRKALLDEYVKQGG
ncbi:MAG: amino acid adenylation domain-containing protein [bacterium]